MEMILKRLCWRHFELPARHFNHFFIVNDFMYDVHGTLDVSAGWNFNVLSSHDVIKSFMSRVFAVYFLSF